MSLQTRASWAHRLAVVAAGALLVAVGCSDDDDDADEEPVWDESMCDTEGHLESLERALETAARTGDSSGSDGRVVRAAIEDYEVQSERDPEGWGEWRRCLDANSALVRATIVRFWANADEETRKVWVQGDVPDDVWDLVGAIADDLLNASDDESWQRAWDMWFQFFQNPEGFADYQQQQGMTLHPGARVHRVVVRDAIVGPLGV